MAKKTGAGLSITIDKRKDIAGFGDEMLEELARDAERAVGGAAEVVEGEVKRLLTLRMGIAAPRGEPPAKQTGELLRAVDVTPTKRRGWTVEAGVEVDHPAAARLEFGHGETHMSGSRPIHFPYVLPAFTNTRAKVDALLRRALG